MDPTIKEHLTRRGKTMFKIYVRVMSLLPIAVTVFFLGVALVTLSGIGDLFYARF